MNSLNEPVQPLHYQWRANVKYSILLLALFLTCGLMSAQVLWQNEAVLRHNYLLEWKGPNVSTPDGGKLVIFSQDGYMQRQVLMQKITASGELAWPQPVLITTNNETKMTLGIVASSDGNYFIQWRASCYQITKVNELGQALWNPAVVDIDEADTNGQASQQDGQGGIYCFFNKNVAGFSTDIWCQHISATGQLLLPDGAIDLTNNTLQESVSSVRLTTDGGAIISYVLITSTSHNYRFLRMTPDYQIAWTIQITPDTNDLNNTMRNFFSPDATNFTVIWSQFLNGQYRLRMQRFDLTGDLQFPTPIEIATCSVSLSSTALLSNDNNIIIGVHGGSNMPPITNFIKKYSYSGETLWGDGIPLPDSIISLSALKADSDGGAYFRYKYMINNSVSYQGTMLQHYDSTGQALLPGVGLVLIPRISNDNSTYQSTTVTDHVISIWTDINEEKYGLYYQIRNLNGDLITDQRMPLQEVLDGDATLAGTVRRDSDILAFWRDSRWWFASDPLDSYYYQIVNPDGSMDMQTDGAILLENVPGIYSTIYPLHLNNGTTLFFFLCSVNGITMIKAQAIDSQGNVLWGENGLVIMNIQSNVDVSNLVVSAEGNAAYLAWSMLSPDSSTRTYIQKVVDGIPQWGPTGMMLSSADPAASVSEIPLSIEGRFVSLKVTTSEPYQRKLWLTHIEPDGSLTPGWPASGIWVDSVNNTYDGYYRASSVLSGGILLLAYGYSDYYQFNAYSYSLIDSQADILASDQDLTDTDFEQYSISLASNNGFPYIVKLIDWDNFGATFAYNRIGLDGAQQWGLTSPHLPSENTAPSSDPSIIDFDNGGYAIYWFYNTHIYCGYVDPLGNYLPLFADQPIVTYCDCVPQGEMLNDELYLTWEDYKAAYFSNYGTEIRMQKLANATVALDDPLVQPPAVNLSCYPNPFNPETTISFSLPSSGKVRLDVYNLRGQLVRSLIDTRLEAGTHSVIWNGKDDSGRDSATGVYLFKLNTDQGNTVRKAMLLK